LKTFLTQIGPTLPLTPDPPVIYFWKWIGWKDYKVPKNRNLESVSTKNELFSHPPYAYPPLYTRIGPTPYTHVVPVETIESVCLLLHTIIYLPVPSRNADLSDPLPSSLAPHDRAPP
jgi:hypothetical protein